MGMPLREYYGIQRAAELLECKTEDLLHWASIGAIHLFIEFESGRGYVHFCDESDGMSDEYINGLGIGDGSSYVHHVYSSDDVELSDFFKTTPPMDDVLPCLFQGLWALPPCFYGLNCIYNDVITTSYDLWLSHNKKMFLLFESNEPLCFCLNDLYIMKADFELIVKGEGKILPNYYNGEVKKPEIESGESVIRVSKAAKDAIKVLIKTHYPEFSGNYKKISDVLSAEAKSIDGMQGVIFDDSTVSRWMKD